MLGFGLPILLIKKTQSVQRCIPTQERGNDKTIKIRVITALMRGRKSRLDTFELGIRMMLCDQASNSLYPV